MILVSKSFKKLLTQNQPSEARIDYSCKLWIMNGDTHTRRTRKGMRSTWLILYYLHAASHSGFRSWVRNAITLQIVVQSISRSLPWVSSLFSTEFELSTIVAIITVVIIILNRWSQLLSFLRRSGILEWSSGWTFVLCLGL